MLVHPAVSLAGRPPHMLSHWEHGSSCPVKTGVAIPSQILNEWNCPLQDADGEWRDDVLEALDFVIEAARSHGLRVMLSFADNWKYLGETDL